MVKILESGRTISSGCYDDKRSEESCDGRSAFARSSSCINAVLVDSRWGYKLEEEAQSTPTTRPTDSVSAVLTGPRRQPGPRPETVSMAHHVGPKFDICFTPGTPNPAVGNQLQLRQWLHSWLPVSIRASQWRTIDNWRIPRFVELTYPACKDSEDARLLVGWITWLHLFDDEFDRPPISHRRDAAEAFVTPYLHCIWQLASGRAVGGDLTDDLLRMFLELNERTVAPMSNAWRTRWFDDLQSYVRACIVETVNRANGIVLAPEDLLHLKRTCMAQRPAINLIERVATGELSPAVFSLLSPAIDIVSDITSSVNDPISLARERSRGDTHNMIVSLTQHHSMTESEAIEHLVEFVHTRCHDLAETTRVLPDSPIVGGEREDVAQWLEICGQWIRGYHDWLLETRRYKMLPSVSDAHPMAEPLL